MPAAIALCAVCVVLPPPSLSVTTFPMFLGTNVPWKFFGYDIGGGAWDADWFDRYFTTISGVQNVVRFFLHCDGRASPHFGSDGSVIGLAHPTHGGASTFSRELGELVQLTRTHRLVLQLVLWSFDMCRRNGFPLRDDLIRDAAKTRSYVENALRPLLQSLDDAECEHCIIEIINEPEWCIEDSRLDRCPGSVCVPKAAMQTFVATLTSTIHAHSPLRKVTVGSASLKWSAPTSNGRSVANLWADAELLAAAPSTTQARGRPTLDLLNTHFWSWQERDDGFGPCNVNSAAFWHFEDQRPVVYAEMPSHIHSHVDRDSRELLGCVLSRGFHGALFWAYNDPGSKLGDASATIAAVVESMPPGVASFEALLSWVRSPTPPHPPPSPSPPLPPPALPGGASRTSGSYTPCEGGKAPTDCAAVCPGSSYTFCWNYGVPRIGGVTHEAWQDVCWGQLAHPACVGVNNALPPLDGAPGQCFSSQWRQYPCSGSAPVGKSSAAVATKPLPSPLAKSLPPSTPPPPLPPTLKGEPSLPPRIAAVIAPSVLLPPASPSTAADRDEGQQQAWPEGRASAPLQVHPLPLTGIAVADRTSAATPGLNIVISSTQSRLAAAEAPHQERDVPATRRGAVSPAVMAAVLSTSISCMVFMIFTVYRMGRSHDRSARYDQTGVSSDSEESSPPSCLSSSKRTLRKLQERSDLRARP